MSVTRLRAGELLALGGAVVIIVASLLPWYEIGGASPSSWARFGTVTVLIVISAAAAAWLAVSNVAERSPALPVAAGVWTTVAGLAVAIGVLTVVLGHLSSLCVGSWLALIGALAILAGGWQSLRDERTELYRPAEPPAQPPPL